MYIQEDDAVLVCETILNEKILKAFCIRAFRISKMVETMGFEPMAPPL